MRTKYKVSVGVLVGLLVIGGLLDWMYASSPKTRFKRLVAQPIPRSVHSLEVGGFQGMDAEFRVLRFQIGRADLQAIFENHKFVPINEAEEFKRWDKNSQEEKPIQKEEYLRDWEQKILRLAKMDVHFTSQSQIFIRQEGRSSKFLFTDTNDTAVVFVADLH